MYQYILYQYFTLRTEKNKFMNRLLLTLLWLDFSRQRRPTLDHNWYSLGAKLYFSLFAACGESGRFDLALQCRNWSSKSREVTEFTNSRQREFE